MLEINEKEEIVHSPLRNDQDDTSYFWSCAQGIVEKAFSENKIFVYNRDSQEYEIDRVIFYPDGKIDLIIESTYKVELW